MARATLIKAIQIKVRVSQSVQALVLVYNGGSEESDGLAIPAVHPLFPQLVVQALYWHGEFGDQVGRFEGLVASLLYKISPVDESTDVINEYLHVVLFIEDAVYVVKLCW